MEDFQSVLIGGFLALVMLWASAESVSDPLERCLERHSVNVCMRVLQ